MAVAIFDIAYYTFWFGGERELNHELIPDRLAERKKNAASLFQKEHTSSTYKTTVLVK